MGRISLGAAGKGFPIDAFAAVQHAHATQYGKVAEAYDIGPLQAEQQNHFRRPYTDAFESGKRLNGFGIRCPRKRGKVKFAALHLRRNLLNVGDFFEGGAALLQLGGG